LKKVMCALFYGCTILILLMAVTGCQTSDSSGSILKADQIVFDTVYTVSVFKQDQSIASGTFESNGTEIVFTVSEPDMAKGMTYCDNAGVFTISLNGFTLETSAILSSESTWFTKLAHIIRYIREQPQTLQAQGSGQFSGFMADGTEFKITTWNKGTIENITFNQFYIQFS